MEARTLRRLSALVPVAALAGCTILTEPDRLEFRDDRLEFSWAFVADAPPPPEPRILLRGEQGRIVTYVEFADGVCYDLTAGEAREGRTIVLRVSLYPTSQVCPAVLSTLAYEAVHEQVAPGDWAVRIEHDRLNDGRKARTIAVESVAVD